MHDVDRTYEAEEEYEYEGESEEFLGALIGPAANVISGLIGGGELEAPFSEMETMELASELLEVQSEDELEQFLGDLIKKAGSAIGSFVRSDTGKALTGIAKDVAKQALPRVGSALGGYFGPTGGQIGGQLGQMAGNLLGLELEGLSSQEAELEAAKGVVRMTGAAAAAAAQAPRRAPARQVAQQAVQAAARRHAPGLVGAQRGPRPRRGGGARPRPQQRQRPQQRRRPSAPSPQLAQAYGLPSWVVEDVSPEPYGYDGGNGYEPGYGNGDAQYGGGGYDEEPVRGGRSSGRWVRRRGQIVLLGV
jgi:hypothetical protein